MKGKAKPYLEMALLPFLFLALELLILFVESLFYGTMNFLQIAERHGVCALFIHWGVTCVVWGSGAWLMCFPKRGYAEPYEWMHN